MNYKYKKDMITINVSKENVREIISKYRDDGWELYGEISDYNSTSLTFLRYIDAEKLIQDEKNNEEKIVRASRYSGVTKEDLINTFTEKGLVGVYNLGLKSMLDYLNR